MEEVLPLRSPFPSRAGLAEERRNTRRVSRAEGAAQAHVLERLRERARPAHELRGALLEEGVNGHAKHARNDDAE
jgi:hypothetical protein